MDNASNVYVADTGNNTIRIITPNGTVTTLAGSAGNSGSSDGTGSAAQFESPYGVAVDQSNNVYVADSGNNTIRLITPDGIVATLAGLAGARGTAGGTGTPARFYFPEGVAADNSGNLYVADTGNDTIRKITPNALVSTIAGLAGSAGSSDGTRSVARFKGPGEVAVDGAGNVYVADTGNSTIRKITPAGVVTTIGGLALHTGVDDGLGTVARFSAPAGVAVDYFGHVLVADSANNAIRTGLVPPQLSITWIGGSVMLSWPANSVGFGLEQNPTLETGNWCVVAVQPILSGSNNVVTSSASATVFYRLKK